VIAVLSIIAILLILSNATLKEFAATGVTLAIASVLYRLRRHPQSAPPAGVA